AAYCVDLAERAARSLSGPDQVAWLARLDQDRDNMRAALRWAADQEDARLALRLCLALVPYWEIRGSAGEGRRWLEAHLTNREQPFEPALHLRAVLGVGRLALFQPDLEAAVGRFEEGRVLAADVSDRRLLADAVTGLGVAHRRGG